MVALSTAISWQYKHVQVIPTPDIFESWRPTVPRISILPARRLRSLSQSICQWSGLYGGGFAGGKYEKKMFRQIMWEVKPARCGPQHWKSCMPLDEGEQIRDSSDDATAAGEIFYVVV